jgi:hypothetical protein
MLRRIESDDALERTGLRALAPRENAAVPSLQLDADAHAELLPHGHPKWVRDGVAISSRARELLARVRPVVVRVLHFWDHGVRAILVSGRRVHVDPSGCYRTE